MSLTGLQMGVSLIVWKVESNKSEELKTAFSKYLVPYIFYWILAIIMFLVFGFAFVAATISDSHLKRARSDKTGRQEIQGHIDKMVRSPRSLEGVESGLWLIQNKIYTEWTSHFQRYILMSYMAKDKCKLFKALLNSELPSCKICAEKCQPREVVIDANEFENNPEEAKVDEVLVHLECMFRSQFATPLSWTRVSKTMVAYLEAQRTEMKSHSVI